jgi:hypothetical protein
MVIESLYTDYFQKSKAFMYPVLGVKRGSSVTPIETYVSWVGHLVPEDMRLICKYHMREDAEFINFEKSHLRSSKYFERFHLLDDKTGLYIFDMSKHKSDWYYLLTGKYSKFSNNHKNIILKFFGGNSSSSVYIDSFLNPKKYFEIYAKLLDVPKELLESVGELCSMPDLEKESLVSLVEDFDRSVLIN